MMNPKPLNVFTSAPIWAGLIVAVALAGGCPATGDDDGGEPEPVADAGDVDGPDGGEPEPSPEPEPEPSQDAGPPLFPPARTDATDMIGSNAALELATWNIENFPQSNASAELVADFVASLGLDVIAVQEIANTDAWDELLIRLPGYDGVLSSDTYSDGSYQKVGFLYARDRVTLVQSSLLFTSDGYEFPRPPLRARFQYLNGTNEKNFTAISLHLKAGGDGEDRQRRKDAIIILDSYIAAQGVAGNEDFVILGDFNEVLVVNAGLDTFGPLVENDSLYTVLSEPLANAGQPSFLPGGSMLDHVIVTDAFENTFSNASAQVLRLDNDLTTYNGAVSDHVPVAGILTF